MQGYSFQCVVISLRLAVSCEAATLKQVIWSELSTTWMRTKVENFEKLLEQIVSLSISRIPHRWNGFLVSFGSGFGFHP